MAAPGKGDLSADCGGGIEGIPPGDLPVDVLLDDSQDIHAWRESRQRGKQKRTDWSKGRYRPERLKRNGLRRSWSWCWP